MDKTDMLWIEINENTNEITLFDGWSNFASKPEVDSLLGGKMDWNLLGNSAVNGSRAIKLKRKMFTRDKYDIDIEPKKMNVSWAIGSSKSINYHTNKRGVVEVDFGKGRTRNNNVKTFNSSNNSIPNSFEKEKRSKNNQTINVENRTKTISLPPSFYEVIPNKFISK